LRLPFLHVAQLSKAQGENKAQIPELKIQERSIHQPAQNRIVLRPTPLRMPKTYQWWYIGAP
jgi:hypothetical protein